MEAEYKREADISQREAVKLQKAGAKLSITNQHDLVETARFLAKVEQFNKAVAAKKRTILGSLHIAVKEINDLFADTEQRGAILERNIKAAMLEYQEAVAAAARQQSAALEQQLASGAIDMADGASMLDAIETPTESIKTNGDSVRFRTVRNVRITSLYDLPTHYWLRPSVVKAIENEVRRDVLKGRRPCPPGAEVYEEKIVAISKGAKP